jgi:hypothetical protein
VSPLGIILGQTALLAVLVVLTIRLDSRSKAMSPYLKRGLGQGRGLVVFGGIGWLLSLVIFANGLRGTAGVGMSELILVAALTFILLGLAGLQLFAVWLVDRSRRSRKDE